MSTKRINWSDDGELLSEDEQLEAEGFEVVYVDSKRKPTQSKSFRSTWLDDFDFDDYRDRETNRVGGIWNRYSYGVNRTDNAMRLATAQKLCQGFVDTFATGDLPYRVTFSDQVQTAGTSFRERQVVISHKPLFDSSLTDDEANTILTAMSAHEASHVRYGRETSRAIDAAFGSDAKAARIANILDDVRIERRFAEDYPGYANVFDPALTYVATTQLKAAGVEALDPKAVKPIDLAGAAVRYPSFVAWTPETESERVWWSDWKDRGTANDSPEHHVAAVQEALDHLREMTEQRAQEKAAEKQEQEQSESEQSESEQSASESSESSEQSDGSDSGSQSESEQDSESEGESSPLPDCFADGVSQAAQANGMSENLTEAEAQNLVEQGKALTDQLSDGSRGEVYWSPNGICDGKADIAKSATATAAIRAAFARSRTGHSAPERNHKSGKLDNRSLTRVAMNDFRLFTRRSGTSEGKFLVWVLVDCSGSMRGRDVRDASAVASALATASRYLPNVRLDIWGWTEGFKLGGSFGAVRVWSTGDPITNVGYLPNVPMGGTPDYNTLEWAGKAILKAAKPGETPVIILATDGAGYIQTPELPNQIRSTGVEVVSVSIGSSVGPAYQSSVYGKDAIAWQGSIVRTAGPLGKLLARIATGR